MSGKPNPRYAQVLDFFRDDHEVTLGEKKGFGAGALKVNSRIFAMMSSREEFVVKLPRQRVTELVARGKGVPFDPGHGRAMKEWLVVEDPDADWIALAREARAFAVSAR